MGRRTLANWSKHGNGLVAGATVLFSICVGASACAPGGAEAPRVVQPATVPVPPSLPPPPPSRGVTIGEKVDDALEGHGSRRVYELTAQSDGLLVVQLSWNPAQGQIELWLEDRQFASRSSPVVGTLDVSAGRKYRVMVVDGSPWDYDDLFVRFVLATSVE